jgi:hypothetical protein
LFYIRERRHASALKEHGVTDGTARATRVAKAAAVILTAVSCSVYDASLIGGGPAPGTGGNGSAGHSGVAGQMNAGGHAGVAGKPVENGGAGGSSSGDGGMSDTAGAMDAAGEGPEGGTAGGSGTAGSAGSAGSSGANGGRGGSGGSAGSTAGGGGTLGGGSGGSGGTAAGAGTGGAPPVTGCAKLSVPMDDTNDRVHFVISLSSAIDLSSMTTGIVTMHLYVEAGAAGTIFNYVQDSQYHYFGVTTASRPALSSLSGWQTLSFPVGAQPVGSTAIVKTDIRRIGIEINAAPDTAGWSKPTVVYIDSIAVVSPALSFPFDTTATVSTTPTGSDVAGQVLWQHNGSSDTTTTGVTLTWQNACP